MSARAASWLLAPVHVASVATKAKSFRDNPVIGSPALNRMGLHVARKRLAHAMSDWRRRRLAHLIRPEDVAAFREEGFVERRGFLPERDFAALRREVLAFAAPARQMTQGDAVTRRVALDRRALARLPALAAMLESPEWLGLMRYAASFALEPIVYIQTIFSHARAGERDPQTNFHADSFHPSMKAWLFLTDVAEEDGPLTYVPGSHRLTQRRLAWERRASITAAESPDQHNGEGSFRITKAELKRLGYGPPRAFAVPANTLVVADMAGFHARGASTRPSVRMEIWAFGRRNPFLPWTGLDPAALPLVKGRGVPLYWSALDLAERLGLARNPWQAAGILTPGAPVAASRTAFRAN